MKFRSKKTQQRQEQLFDDPLVNQFLKKLSDLGRGPISEGPTGEERELRHKHIVDVATLLLASISQMPAVHRAMCFSHPQENPDGCTGFVGTFVAALFRLDPEDLMRHVSAPRGQNLPVRTLSAGGSVQC